MPDTYHSQSKFKLIALCLSVVVIAGAVVVINYLKSGSTNSGRQTPDSGIVATGSQMSQASSSTAATDPKATYKDGTYAADTEYYVPHGYEDIKVTLTLKNGVVTDSQIVNSENDRDSQQFQEDFAAQYKSYVVGKKVSDVHVAYIAGASDTAQGFNDAVNKIAAQAKA